MEIQNLTNKYIETGDFDESDTPSGGRQKLRFDTTADDLKAFIALCHLQSQAKKDKLQSYCSTAMSNEISFLL